MANPLEPVRDWYRLTLDCMRVAQRTARINLDRAVTDKHATLFHLAVDDRLRVIEGSKSALSRLAVLDLAAVFERAVREHLTATLDVLIPGGHSIFGAALRERVRTDAEWWKFEDLVDLYPNVAQQTRGLVKDVIKFRNWAAHGWHTTAEPAPSNITADEAYLRLTDFLTAAGIAT